MFDIFGRIDNGIDLGFFFFVGVVLGWFENVRFVFVCLVLEVLLGSVVSGGCFLGSNICEFLICGFRVCLQFLGVFDNLYFDFSIFIFMWCIQLQCVICGDFFFFWVLYCYGSRWVSQFQYWVFESNVRFLVEY